MKIEREWAEKKDYSLLFFSGLMKTFFFVEGDENLLDEIFKGKITDIIITKLWYAF